MQTKIVGPMPEQVKHAVMKSKKRSIGHVILEPPTYNVGQRVGPPNVRSVDADTTKKIQDAKTKNLIWFLARMTYPEIQTICCWTGFNIQIRFQDAGLQDLCLESGVIAEGSVTGVMEGRKPCNKTTQACI